MKLNQTGQMTGLELVPLRRRVSERWRRSALERRRSATGLLAIMPAMVMVVIFFLIPLGLAVWMSMTRWNIAGFKKYVGFANYSAIPADQIFLHAVVFTTLYATLITTFTFFIGLGLALLVQSSQRRFVVLRTMFYLPVVIGTAVASFIFLWLFNDEIGAANGVLRGLGLIKENVSWLGNSDTALIVLIVMTVWKSAGFAMVVLLIGLQAVPREVYEAATVDGATGFQKLWKITIPLIRSSIALVVVLLFVNSFLAFDQFYIITRGGPHNSTITAVYWIFHEAFISIKFGYAAALSVVLLGFLVIVSAIQLRVLHREPLDA